MVRVWWTVRDSPVAWEWRPAEPAMFDASRIVEDDGTQYLGYAGRIPGPPRPYLGLPIGQPLADTTALFAQEANLLPTNLVITWIMDGHAARWDRTTDGWTRHAVTPRPDGPAVGPAHEAPGVPERLRPAAWSPVWAAGEIAMSLLGLTRRPTGTDERAHQVELNQRAIRREAH